MLGIQVGALVHVAAAALGSRRSCSSRRRRSTSSSTPGPPIWSSSACGSCSAGSGSRRPVSAPPRRLDKLFAQGIVVNILNPKTALSLFFAFLPQFVDVEQGLGRPRSRSSCLLHPHRHRQRRDVRPRRRQSRRAGSAEPRLSARRALDLGDGARRARRDGGKWDRSGNNVRLLGHPGPPPTSESSAEMRARRSADRCRNGDFASTGSADLDAARQAVERLPEAAGRPEAGRLQVGDAPVRNVEQPASRAHRRACSVSATPTPRPRASGTVAATAR